MIGDLVSIIIPTHGRPNKLSRAIESVLHQTYSNIELIVVDDNNPDTVARTETSELVASYVESPLIKYIEHDYNKNGSAARNTGFRYSSGKYIMFLDDDDEFLKKKVEIQVNCLEFRESSWGACYTKYKRFKNGKFYSLSAENREGNLYFEVLCRNLFIAAGSNLMVRREAFQETGGFDESFLRNQDIEFLVRLLKKYKLAYVNEVGLINHKHPVPRNFNMERITEHYINTFKPEINKLTKEKKKIFNKMINLQLFRYKLITKRSVKDCYSMIKKRDVTIKDILRYLIHLSYRFIFKKSKGFKI